MAIRIARAKGIDFFTIDPRRLRKYDNRDAIDMLEIYTLTITRLLLWFKKNSFHRADDSDFGRPGQIDLPGMPSYDAPPVGAWRSLVAHLLWEQRVGGSNPSAPTI